MAFDAVRKRTVLFGGEAGAKFGDTWEWNGHLWVQVADSGPSPRARHAMAYDQNRNRVVLFGGASQGNLVGDTWEWDGEYWTEVADTGPPARQYLAMASDTQRKRIVLFGGVAVATYGDTWEWDGNQWTQHEGVGPPARANHAMAHDPQRQRTVIYGGRAGVNFTDTWEWDGSQWLQVAHFGPNSLLSPAMAFNGRGVTLFGGAKLQLVPRDGGMDYTFIPYGETWEWDGKLWVERRDFGPGARVDHAMSYDSARKVIVMFGGTGDASGNPLQARFGDTWEPFDREPIPDSG
jgi:galactose oxidase-like protein